MLKDNNKTRRELKVGDKVTFLETLYPFKKFGEIIVSTYMASFKGTQCTISHINQDNTFKIKEDERGYSFSRDMIKEPSLRKDYIIDLEYLKEQDIAICCETIEKCKELFLTLNDFGVVWNNDTEIEWKEIYEYVFKECNCFSLTQDGKLEYCSSNWYWENGYRVVNFKDIKIVKNK